MAGFLYKDTGLPYFWSKLKEILGSRSVSYTSVASLQTGDTSYTFTDSKIKLSSTINVEYRMASENPFFYTKTTTTTGQCIVTFPALTEAAEMRLEIINSL